MKKEIKQINNQKNIKVRRETKCEKEIPRKTKDNKNWTCFFKQDQRKDKKERIKERKKKEIHPHFFRFFRLTNLSMA